jgi:hypothetical protein
MHTELNFGLLLHDRELERNEHMAQGLRLRALDDNDETLTSRWQESNGVLRWRWNLARLRHDDEASAAEAA